MGPVVTNAAKLLKCQLLDAVAVCSALGLDAGARRQTNGLLIRCPWHDDREPSCSVTITPAGSLRVHCFACGNGGDVFSLIAQVHGLDVQRDFPRVLACAEAVLRSTVRTATPPIAPPPRLADGRFDALARGILTRAPLRRFSPGGDYLEGRRLLEAAVSDGWGCLPASCRDQHATLQPITSDASSGWLESGLFKPDRSLRFARNVLLIPWRSADGAIASLQRRVLGDGLDAHKYVFPSGRPAAAPYGVDALACAPREQPVAYVEGAVDVLAYRALCGRAGHERVVLGLPGAAAWRREWADYARGRTALIALDADGAGDAAVERMRGDLLRAGALEVIRKRPVGAKDWAAVLRARTT